MRRLGRGRRQACRGVAGTLFARVANAKILWYIEMLGEAVEAKGPLRPVFLCDAER